MNDSTIERVLLWMVSGLCGADLEIAERCGWASFWSAAFWKSPLRLKRSRRPALASTATAKIGKTSQKSGFEGGDHRQARL
jgi:hypothetical protein